MKKIIILILTLFSVNSYSSELDTILFIGDSHSYGKMGTTIESNLSKVFRRVVMESSCGSSPINWQLKTAKVKTVCGFWMKDGNNETRVKIHETPNLIEELEKYRPNLTIVELGTNIAAAKDPIGHKSSIESMMKSIIETKAQCIWIGPPDANSKFVTKENLKITNELLKNLSFENGCHYIDSLSITKFPLDSKEGIHYPPQLSKEWGEKLSSLIFEITKAK